MYNVYSLVLILHIWIIFFCASLWKWWYFIAICFVLGDNLLDSATEMQLWFYLNTLQNTSGFGICISQINDNDFINAIKGITFHIDWINTRYSASMILKVITFCNQLHHSTGHPAYVSTYPIRDMKFSVLSASTWSHPPSKLASTNLCYFLYIGTIN